LKFQLEHILVTICTYVVVLVLVGIFSAHFCASFVKAIYQVEQFY